MGPRDGENSMSWQLKDPTFFCIYQYSTPLLEIHGTCGLVVTSKVCPCSATVAFLDQREDRMLRLDLCFQNDCVCSGCTGSGGGGGGGGSSSSSSSSSSSGGGSGIVVVVVVVVVVGVGSSSRSSSSSSRSSSGRRGGGVCGGGGAGDGGRGGGGAAFAAAAAAAGVGGAASRCAIRLVPKDSARQHDNNRAAKPMQSFVPKQGPP